MKGARLQIVAEWAGHARYEHDYGQSWADIPDIADMLHNCAECRQYLADIHESEQMLDDTPEMPRFLT